MNFENVDHTTRPIIPVSDRFYNPNDTRLWAAWPGLYQGFQFSRSCKFRIKMGSKADESKNCKLGHIIT